MRRALQSVLLILFIALGACHHKQPVPGIDEGAPAEKKIDVPALEKQVQRSPEDVKAWIALGNGLYDTNQWARAVDAYQKALELDPKNVDVHVDLGTCYRNTGKSEKAVEEYRTAIAIDPNHKNARWNAGVVLLYDLNKRKEALTHFEKYLELAGDRPEAEPVRKVVDELRAELK